MSKVQAVAFAFTRPDAVVYIGKGWKDKEGKRYRIHVYPSVRRKNDAAITLAKDRPNVVLLLRADKASALNEYASRLHRLIVLGPPDELIPLGIPILDVVEDDKGKLVSAPPRANVDYYNRRVEEDATSFDLAPLSVKIEKSKKKERKKKNHRSLPLTFSLFLDEIESYLDEEGSVWEDLESPVLKFFLGNFSIKEFEQSCKALVRLGVNKKLCRAYFRWVAIEDQGLNLSATFEIVARSLDEGISIDIRSLAKKSEVDLKDLAALYNMYQAEMEEKE